MPNEVRKTLAAAAIGGGFTTLGTALYINDWRIKIFHPDYAPPATAPRTQAAIDHYINAANRKIGQSNFSPIRGTNAYIFSPFAYSAVSFFHAGKYQRFLLLPSEVAQQDFIDQIKNYPSSFFESYGLHGQHRYLACLERYGLPCSWRPFGEKNARELVQNAEEFITAHELSHLKNHDTLTSLVTPSLITGANAFCLLASASRFLQSPSPATALMITAITAATIKNYSTHVADDDILSAPPIPLPLPCRGIAQRKISSQISQQYESRADAEAIAYARTLPKERSVPMLLSACCLFGGFYANDELEEKLLFRTHPKTSHRAENFMRAAQEEMSQPQPR